MDKPLKYLLNKHNLNLKKQYGQNFLTDVTLLDQIVEQAGVTENDVVLEIGCGAGALTSALCRKAKKVIGYEIDTRLKPVLSETLEDYSNVEIVFADVMKQKITEVEKSETTITANGVTADAVVLTTKLTATIARDMVVAVMDDLMTSEEIKVLIIDFYVLKSCSV